MVGVKTRHPLRPPGGYGTTFTFYWLAKAHRYLMVSDADLETRFNDTVQLYINIIKHETEQCRERATDILYLPINIQAAMKLH